MFTKSDMDLISKHCEEKELLPEEKQQQKHDFEGSEQGVRIDTIDSEDDDFQYQFNFDLSVAIIEEETDEVESEFFDSVKEIEGNLLLARIARKYANRREVLRGTLTPSIKKPEILPLLRSITKSLFVKAQ